MSKKKIVMIEGVPSDRDLDKLADELLTDAQSEKKETSEEEPDEIE